MIPLAFSTNAFKKNTLAQAIDAIASIGYRGVELMADIPHAYPPSLDTAQRDQIKNQIASRGLSVSNINAFTLFADGDTYHPTWIEPQESRRQRRITHTIQCIELAAQMGSKTVSLQPGGPLLGTDLDRQQAGDLFASGLQAVLPTAKKFGIILAIEPEPGLFIQTSTEYAEFKKTYFPDEPHVRMNFDIGHLFCVGENPAQVMRAMRSEIAHIHLEDIGENRVHQHLTPGKGAINFPEIFTALREINYPGWVTVELYPYEATAEQVAKFAWNHLFPTLAFGDETHVG
jgi:sugar phosphate isomerase/epimerase